MTRRIVLNFSRSLEVGEMLAVHARLGHNVTTHLSRFPVEGFAQLDRTDPRITLVVSAAADWFRPVIGTDTPDGFVLIWPDNLPASLRRDLTRRLQLGNHEEWSRTYVTQL